MSKKAFLFPGQASQYVGMGSDLYERYAIAREMFKKANDILEFDITSLCFDGPAEELKQTRNTQPAIFLHSIIVTTILRELGILPGMTAGHSLGEYSALVAAGAISFEHGLKLVRQRGMLMQVAGEISPGTMAAIIGLSYEDVKNICAEAEQQGIVTVANLNSPGQIVISGSIEGVHKAMELAKEQGAKRAIELVVSGAFHSPLMESSQEEFKNSLDQAEIKNAEIPVYANVTAQPVQNAAEIKKLLFEQLTNPVLWETSARAMLKDNATEFFEVGPGNVLAGLQKRIDRSVQVKTVGKVDEIQTLET